MTLSKIQSQSAISNLLTYHMTSSGGRIVPERIRTRANCASGWCCTPSWRSVVWIATSILYSDEIVRVFCVVRTFWKSNKVKQRETNNGYKRDVDDERGCGDVETAAAQRNGRCCGGSSRDDNDYDVEHVHGAKQSPEQTLRQDPTDFAELSAAR